MHTHIHRLYKEDVEYSRATPWDGTNGDVSLQKLGVSTDNGAYFYYNTGPNATSEEEALCKVHDVGVAENIPFSYVLLDSWWYYKVRLRTEHKSIL